MTPSRKKLFANFPRLLLAVVLGGCAGPQVASKDPLPENIQDGQLIPAPIPDRSQDPGKQALLDWAQECYGLGMQYNPIFARGGSVLVRWTGDRDAHLLRLEFVSDTFARWEIDAAGTTMADCISRRANQSAVEWSAEGLAPLRFSPSESTAPPPQSSPVPPNVPSPEGAD